MIRFIMVMAPAVFLINGLTKHDWLEALLFAVAVAVGLTPEMLPMIVTVNLAKGAIAMSREKVIVKRLNAIQNFGAMDVLCTDKTGTLTQDRIILKRHLDINGEESATSPAIRLSQQPFSVGAENLLDVAVLAACRPAQGARHRQAALPSRRNSVRFSRAAGSSVVVAAGRRQASLICKGAVEEIFAVCSRYEVDGETGRARRKVISTPPRRMTSAAE